MNRAIIKYFLPFFILYSLLFNHNCFTQSLNELGSPFIRNFTTDEYNATTQNWAIVQDNRGIMYFGNGSCLLEYDGNNWNKTSLPNNSSVRSLAIDSLGTVYVGASGEFGYVGCDSTGKILYISLINKLKKEDRDFNEIWKTCITSDGVFFISIHKIFRYLNDSITVIPVNIGGNIAFTINNRLFVIQRNKGIFAFKNNLLEPLPFCKEFSDYRGSIEILPFIDNKLLFAVKKKGLYIYDIEALYNNDIKSLKQDKSFSSKILRKLPTEIDTYLNENRIYSSAKISDNSYAFATLGDGIIIIDSIGKIVRIINKNYGLQNNIVWSIFTDKNQNLWAGLNNGISFIEISSPITKFDNLNKLEESVYSIVKHNGKVYVGTMDGIHYLPDSKTKIKNNSNNFIPVKNISSSCWDFLPKKNILLAFGRKGIFHIHDTLALQIFKEAGIYSQGKSSKFPNRIFLGETDGFSSVEIIYHDNKNKSDKIELINRVKINEINESIRKITSDNKGNLWLTTSYSGIIYIKFPDNNITNYKITRYDTAHGLPQLNYNYVYSVGSNIFVASQEGIYKAIIASNNKPAYTKFIPDTSFGKVLSSGSVKVTKIYCNNEDQILINSDNLGLGIINKTLNGYHNWNTTPYKKLPLGAHNFTVDENNVIWYCSSKGLFRFDQNIEKEYNATFNTLIRKVTIAKDSIIFNGTFYNDINKNKMYFKSFDLSQPEQLIPYMDFKNNSITFYFSALFFEHSSENKYSCYLEGFDSPTGGWSNWSQKTSKEYTNLNEGNYIFRVKAKNIFDTEGREAIYKFTVLPPWYRTILAYILYLTGFILIFYLGIRINTQRLKAANLKLEQIVKERTIEILNQKKEISAQRDEIEKQRDIVIQQKDEITDSIIYAKRIQTAVLPPVELISNNLSGYFILFKPRDIVSGDFYWMKKTDNYLIIAVADCTGHGVPGAFMSMLGIALLNDIVRYKEITTASQALNELRSQVKAALRQSGKEGEAEDGIDMALCVIDFENMKMQFAGARNSLCIIRNEEFTEIKADKMPIGIYYKDDQSFTNHTIDIQNGDIFYLFSDGFIDQFGGTENKRYTSRQFKDLLKEIHNKPMPEQKAILNKTLTNWMGNEEQIDDITVIGMKI